MERRLEIVKPEEKPDEEVIVMTLKQTGDIVPREAGKGKIHLSGWECILKIVRLPGIKHIKGI